MQAPAVKDKKREGPASKEEFPTVASDPEYENITLTFKHRAPPKGHDKLPKNPGPAQWNHPSTLAPVPRWLYRAVLSLYIILALTFLFCIFLSAFILFKNSEMSRELLELKMELRNISSSLRGCQEEQKASQTTLLEAIKEAQKSIVSEHDVVNSYRSTLNTIVKDTSYIKSKVNTIFQKLEKPNPTPAPARTK